MNMLAVSGTRRAMKELVDGTLRVQIDIEPRFKKDFLDLFGEIDMPVALAPLNPAALDAGPINPDVTQPARAVSSWAGLGPLAQSAVLVAKDRVFQEYVEEMIGKEGVDEVGAANFIKDYCKVASRKDLDATDGGRERYGALMAHYREWRTEEVER